MYFDVVTGSQHLASKWMDIAHNIIKNAYSEFNIIHVCRSLFAQTKKILGKNHTW